MFRVSSCEAQHDFLERVTEAIVPNALMEGGSAQVESSFVGVPPATLNRSYEAGCDPTAFMYRVAKRCVDVTLCCLCFPFIAPLFLAIALAIRLSSPGPVFYQEKRVGQFGKKFTIFKFRSMYTSEYLRDVLNHNQCEAAQREQRLDSKHKHDPRITAIGRNIRRLSLDELPQLINVLRGEMSLIGPRPVVDFELERYGDHAHCYTLMVPGMSGLWQVSGRNDLSYERRVSIDAEYFATWSPLLDMRILWRTIPAVVKCRGAY
jgi:lipopolysaccharide/colanic/teichoic acid biosynthesis glycosyltransferase